mmetsp:Transcript_40112/g.103857  ORF Transcript_40112/g.103857 Transcript_40112/m.103857 type:complete len:229 (+) Transcript_40112:889-1575(+)
MRGMKKKKIAHTLKKSSTRPSTMQAVKVDLSEIQGRPSSAPGTDRESARLSLAHSAVLSDAVQKEYLELGKIGAGSFGSVHKVRRILTGDMFALKRVPCQDMHEANAILKEVKLWNKLEHANIVQYKDFLMNQVVSDKEHGSIGFEVCMVSVVTPKLCFRSFWRAKVMEYCSGGDLHRRLQREPRPTDEQVQKWMVDLLSAVSFLHSSSIIHRDIKVFANGSVDRCAD